MVEILVSLARGFWRKLLILLAVDAAIGILRSFWEKAAMTGAVGFFLVQLPYSLILAAIWSAVDGKRSQSSE